MPPRDPQVQVPPVDWVVSDGLTDYQTALDIMDRRNRAIACGAAPELVWLLQHPPLYTAGTSANPADLLTPDRFPVHVTGRGGQYTYHGPGQRVVYVMLNVKTWADGDVRRFVSLLEAWVIAALAHFAVIGRVHPDRVGVWVTRSEQAAGLDIMREDKIAAFGIRLRQWVSMHGLAINVAPDLRHFDGIVPCGVRQHGVTSLADLGLIAGLGGEPTTAPGAGMAALDAALATTFTDLFGPIQRATLP